MPVSLDGLRILVLEDEVLIALDVEQICRDHGASEVVTATSLPEIDGISLADTFDVAIIDMVLDGASTLEFAKQLQDHGVPFVFASGYSITDEIGELFPGVKYVEKPYGGADIVNAVAHSHGTRGTQRADDVIT